MVKREKGSTHENFLTSKLILANSGFLIVSALWVADPFKALERLEGLSLEPMSNH